ncbi:signal transduction histidine kinase/CheY-like chemotaxis protein [Methylobacterium sp. OAE515]|uniref:two-component system VirA-like sensor kinase n=1 Tax=Methylobacterium sp. OAE515 TaxID=2817895 RepID=UPI00178BECD5
MRLTAQAAVLGVLLAGLLTWLMVNGKGEMDAAYVQTQRTIDALALAESRMQHDVLRARTGLLRNYDPIVTHLREMQAALAAIRASSGPDDREVRALAEAMNREAQMVERFKTGNALVQNSIAYFDSLSDRLSEPDIDPWLARAVAALQIRVSELARESSPRRLDDIRARLDALAAVSHPAGRGADIAAIVLHGRQLLELLPQVDTVTRSLPASSSEPARQALLEARRALRDQRQVRADGYQLALYAAALALLVLVVRVGLLMRVGTLNLHRTIAFQTVVAQAANRFLASQPDAIFSCIGEVLATVGSAMSTDHSYILMLDDSGTTYLWNRSGLDSPPGWPQAHQALIPSISAELNDLIFVKPNEHIGSQNLSIALSERGVRSWACVRLRRGEQIIALLCFERSTSELPLWLSHSRRLLQVVADSFGAALERQHVFAERRNIEAALRRAQRLEAIGTFASGVAHNINNVLNVMLGHAEIAADALPADLRRVALHIELLAQAGGRAREIAGQILDYGRRSSTTHHMSAVDAIVAETVAQFHASTTLPTAIRLNGNAGGVTVGGEPAQLQQVVHNLIRNAVQASSPGRAIEVQLESVRSTEHRTMTHGTLRPGAYVKIRVADAGCGMDEATLTRIFEPFFTTRPAGTGLGLATAYEFVQEQAGAFDVHSELGVGSVFEVWLPVRWQSTPDITFSGGTVMLIGRLHSSVEEDEETLAALGYEPVGYEDPAAALAALRSEPTRFDLLIVESHLQNCSGLEFARVASALSRRPIILSVTASDAMRSEELTTIPIADIMPRPWQLNALSCLIQRNIAKPSPDINSIPSR